MLSFSHFVCRRIAWLEVIREFTWPRIAAVCRLHWHASYVDVLLLFRTPANNSKRD